MHVLKMTVKSQPMGVRWDMFSCVTDVSATYSADDHPPQHAGHTSASCSTWRTGSAMMSGAAESVSASGPHRWQPDRCRRRWRTPLTLTAFTTTIDTSCGEPHHPHCVTTHVKWNTQPARSTYRRPERHPVTSNPGRVRNGACTGAGWRHTLLRACTQPSAPLHLRSIRPEAPASITRPRARAS